MAPVSSIAVLGGGISGLSAAFHLLRRYKSPVTLIEATDRVGGWIRSNKQPLPDTGHTMILEGGARTLRPSPALNELLHLTNSSHLIRAMPPNSPAMRNRFFHIPSSDGLTMLPSSPISAFLSPVGRAIFRSMIRDLVSSHSPPDPTDDESVEAFVVRRLGPSMVPLISAFLHGVYAADARELSARVVLREVYAYGSLARYAVSRGLHSLRPPPRRTTSEPDPYVFLDSDASAYPRTPFSLQGGTEALVSAVFDEVSRNARFSFLPHTRVTGMQLTSLTATASGNVDISLLDQTGQESRRTFSHVVSALPLYALRTIVPPSLANHAALSETPYTDVTVVNLVLPRPRTNETPLHPDGFGYLVARPDAGYSTRDSDTGAVLGVIFDSCIAPTSADEHVVRMTAMVGGPYKTDPDSALDLDELRTIIGRQLGYPGPLPKPIYSRVVHAKGCIPTPLVGHKLRTENFKDAVAREWGARVEIIGAAVSGISVGDCIAGGRAAGSAWI